MTDKSKYVLCTAITPDGATAVGITKLKGPEFLLGKVTFPGGKIEPNEDPRDAAARELLEETGIALPATAFVKVDEVHGDGRELHSYVAVTDKTRCARQMEEEPVWLLEVDFHVQQARRQPSAYAPDFLENVARAVRAAQTLAVSAA